MNKVILPKIMDNLFSAVHNQTTDSKLLLIPFMKLATINYNI
ncbi:hypothetical protein [Limosilactobacillus coleohominis]|nr:hypothetical protein [Limosilactobacillus coleohominis]